MPYCIFSCSCLCNVFTTDADDYKEFPMVNILEYSGVKYSAARNKSFGQGIWYLHYL